MFVFLPTGYGKSLIFECLPRLLDHLPDRTSIVIVACPLKALMMDQVKHFRSLGLMFVSEAEYSLPENIMALCNISTSVDIKADTRLPPHYWKYNKRGEESAHVRLTM